MTMNIHPLPPSAFKGEGMTSQRARDRLAATLKESGIRDPRVIEVIRNTPRHHFIDQALHSRAYENTALPIGHGQTISQPWVVARMTEALLEQFNGDVPQKVL
jgi:protein-L-isoaspartate(D-aspartate) O-methyltransferase